MTEIPSWGAVAVSGLLVVVAVAIASWQRLGISRDMLVASLRAFVQLLAVGAVLAWLFRNAGIAGALLWIAIMTVVAANESRTRGRGMPRAFVSSLLGIGLGTLLTLGVLVAGGVISTEPQVLVPIGGMVVSGAMQAASLTLSSLRRSAVDDRPAVEAALSLGLGPREAFARQLRSAVRTALVPAVDSTKIVGLISLPGTMTGLIIAGVEPLEAIRYQIIVMYMLLAAWAVSSLVTARAAERWLFDDAERLVRV
ncbi:MAG: iron export ABC transporter permease subunit FetB [Actinobacteria bacterium]|jgi:putative ABC transport system permease protein|nr:iron export ABC transporter permease subunit FetB [Actinomycetota bacterium]